MKTLNVCRKMSALAVGTEAYKYTGTLPPQSLQAHKLKEHLRDLKQSQHRGRLPPETTYALCIQEACMVTRNLFLRICIHTSSVQPFRPTILLSHLDSL